MTEWLTALITDHWVWAPVVIAVLLNLGLFAFLSIQVSNLNAQFHNLTPVVPLHFNSAGEPDRVEPVGAVFGLPIIGVIVISLNLLLGGLIYRREQMATYLLVGTAAGVQLLLWIAAITVMRAVAV